MSTTRAGFARRALAFLVDGIISVALALVPYAGALLAAVYILARDGLMDGRSPGKTLLRLRVIKSGDSQRAGYIDSIKRNIIFALPDALMVFPALASVLAAPLSLAVLILEVVFMLTDPEGMRLGDRFAGTRVVCELPEVARTHAA